jgi:class 3 adenylate cyclase
VDDRFSRHINVLVVDAADEAARGDWARARALAEAVLALEPENSDAQRIMELADASATPGERRQLTVMFCDVVGSTALSGIADPEVVHDLLSAYQSACAGVITAYDGHIAQFQGDGVVAYFGYPRAHEDDARRAVGAGLDLLSAIGQVARAARTKHNLDLRVRVAVHTGLVVRAEMGGPQHRARDAVVGETPNLAARLQECARPGTLVISGTTYELVRGFFACEPLGRRELRGVSREVDIYEVTARTLAETRLEAAADPAPFVGRRPELERLASLWAGVEDGASASVLLRGEPGVGKSRLALVFRQQVESGGAGAVSCGCSAYRTATPLYPVRRLLASVLGVDLRQNPGAAVEPLRAALASIGRQDLLGAFAELLGFPRDGAWSTVEIDPQLLRHRVLDTLVEWVAAQADRSPVLIVMDDLQWADASTVDLLDRVVTRRVPGLLLVMTARDEFTPSWSEVETIELGRLSEAHLRELVRALPESQDLSEADVTLMIRRSEGVPLYLEELVRAGPSAPPGVGAEARGEARFTAPPALLEPLLARLASPDVDLTLAQLMATVGQEADDSLLQLITGLSQATLRERVGGLITAQLIEAADGDHRTYRFRHQLLGEVAYQMQLLSVRRSRHSAIADVLAALDPPGVPIDAGALAHHLEQADRIEEAIEAHVRAAGDSMRHGGITEAIAQLDHAMGLLDLVSSNETRLGLELTVRQARGMAWATLAGYGSPGAAADMERCADLCRELGAAVDGIPSLWAVWYYCVIRGELDRAEDVILVDRRRLGPDPEGLPEAAAWSGIRFGRGQIRDAIEVMEEFLASRYATNVGSTPTEWPLPDDPVVNTWSTLALARWMAGDPDGAREAFVRGEERARGLDFPHGPFCRAYVLLFKALVYQLAGKTDEMNAAVNDMVAIAERHGFAFFSICAALHRALSESYADPRSAAAALDGAFELYRFMGLDLWNPWGYTVLAERFLLAGDNDGALRCVERASAEAKRTGALFWAAETERIRGLARLTGGDRDGIHDLIEAADLAAQQGALLFELRANLELVRNGEADRRRRIHDLLTTLPSTGGMPEVEAALELLETGWRL